MEQDQAQHRGCPAWGAEELASETPRTTEEHRNLVTFGTAGAEKQEAQSGRHPAKVHATKPRRSPTVALQPSPEFPRISWSAEKVMRPVGALHPLEDEGHLAVPLPPPLSGGAAGPSSLAFFS